MRNTFNGGIYIDWTDDESKLIWWSIRKATNNFTFLPLRYEREDLFQEASEAWLLARGKRQKSLSTFLYEVVEKKIMDLIDMGNAEKRQSDLQSVEYMDGITPIKSIMGEGNRKKAIPVIDYDGDKNIKYCPIPRGAPMAQRLWEEREPEVWED